MKISEIKNKELRELAESRIDKELADLRRKKYGLNENEDELIYAFPWRETKEGFEFWNDVNEGTITELPNDKNSDSEKEPKTKSCDLDFMVQELTLMGDRISEMENRNAKMEDAIKTVIDQMENGKDEKYDIFLNVLRTAIDK